MSLWRRVLVEKRSLVAPLAIALLANIAVYAFVVYPLGVKSATAATRAAQATADRHAAEQDYAAARALVSGTTRADQELQTFYGKVLPADFSTARRLTYTTIPDLAKKAGVRVTERRTDVDENSVKKTGLARLVIRVQLQGDYEGFRQFLYNLESAPEFVIIDSITLVDRASNEPQTVTLDLSTYYRSRANGL